MKLLLVEDDPSMQTALRRTLQNRGMDVELCGDGRQALERWKSAPPDVVMLDLTLPGMDGLLVLEEARRLGLATPVLILTARGTVGDRIIGLNTGADDYLPKPFDLDELEARIRALHRRHQSAGPEAANNLQQVGGLRYEPDSGAIYHRAEVLELTPRELALLKALMVKPGHAVAKERLFEL
ncbi:MAG TPA: response regulator transcription factor, partial [Ramlibacter sp.]|nr:response regulator transcription factor [Ramlibacter sp.]